MIRQLSVAALAAVCMFAMTADAKAQFPRGNYQSPLFSQYVTQGAGASSAAAYPAPHYSPMLGAQSHYTYQPLMPHEMMYQHSRNYYNYYNTGYYGGGALNKTSVRWQAGNNHMGPLPFSTGLSGLSYRFGSRRYCIGGDCGNSGGRVRRIGNGGFGCSGGNCGEAYSSDAYMGDYYQGESAGCASGSCAANTNNATTKR
ncbi:MAG: hypothetical protein AAFN77_09345 [Planctomycetota bacterium]